MHKKWIVFLGAAMLAGAVGGAMLSPAPVGAVAKEMIELQQSVNQVIAAQQAMQTAITQNNAVQQTLIQQSLDSVNKLSGTMGALEKSVQDMQANSGARLDSMSTQIQGISDNLQDMLARMGKLNQQLTDTQTAIQGIDAKLASPPPAAPSAVPSIPGAPNAGGPTGSASSAPAAPLPSADLLYSNGLRDWNGKKYDLAAQEFESYLKYYSDLDLAPNAQNYLGEIAYVQGQYPEAVDAYSKLIDNYPKSAKLANAHLKKGLAMIAIGEKTSGVRELRSVVRLYPGTDEERRARAKLKEMGLTS